MSRLQATTTLTPTGFLAFPIGVLRLRPHAMWAEGVSAFRIFSERDEEEFIKLTAAATRAVAEKAPPQELVAAAMKLFNEHFFLSRGHYTMIVVAVGGSGKVLCIRGFEFVLYETHMAALTAQKAQPAAQLVPSVRLRPIEERRARELYRNKVAALVQGARAAGQ